MSYQISSIKNLIGRRIIDVRMGLHQDKRYQWVSRGMSDYRVT